MGIEQSALQMTRSVAENVRAKYLLGPWCLEYPDSRPNAIVLSSLPPLSSDPIAAARQQRLLYEKVLSALVQWLNEYHGIDRPRKYWETIVYRFLSRYVAEAYVRYCVLSDVAKLLRHVTALALEASNFYVPKCDSELLYSIKRCDCFNLQLFSQLAPYAGLDGTYPDFVGFQFCARMTPARLRGGSFLRRHAAVVRRHTLTFHRALSRGHPHKSVALLDAHFPRSMVVELARSSAIHLKVARIAGPLTTGREIDYSARSRLRESGSASEMAQGILGSLACNLPIEYVEDFGHNHKVACAELTKGVPEVILAGYIPSIVARIWVAEAQLRGTKIVIVQHGGAYGESIVAPWETIERRIANVFAGWGWRGEGVVRLPSPRLQRFRNFSRRKERGKLLFVLRQVFKYPDWGVFLQGVEPGVSEAGVLRRLSPEVRANTILRIRTNKGADPEEQVRWAAGYDVSVEGMETRIEELLAEARMVLVGYPFSTTFAECITAGVPVVVMEDTHYCMRSDAAQPVYQELRRQGVVQTCPEKVAELLTDVWSDPMRWWTQPARMRAVERFRAEFAWTEKEDEAIELWRGFLAKQVRPETISEELEE